MKKSIFLFGLLSFVPQFLFSQYFFKKQTNIPVTVSSRTLKFPWVGGLNNPQFSTADLNNNDTLDLVVFDRTGSKALTFINHGTPDSVDYEYAPQYESAFSKFSQWILMDDFDCDGIEDVFTYNIGEVDYYKGRFDANNHLVFDSVTFLGYNSSFSGFLNIFVSSIDIPAIADINGDGDLDVLTFDILGGVVGYYENQSQELTGTCADTVLFSELENCWGSFFETTVSNVVMLDTCGGFKREPQAGGARHAGSTLLAFDEDGDGDKELILGDISFDRINRLKNDGTPNAAHIVSQDANFPAYDISYNSPIFPASFYVDVNNDNLKDLLVAPNAPLTSENHKCSWYYKNVGTADSVVFSFVTDTFLVSDMLDFGEGAHPVFFDYNNDGLQDIVVGNYGYYVNGTVYRSGLALLENTGDSLFPSFKLVSRDYQGISALVRKAIYPAFGDMDNDGDEDMIAGEFDGFLHYYKNTAGAGNTPNFQLTMTMMFGIDVGQFSAPFIYDVNGDSIPDLLVGEKSGNVDYFENRGTKSTMVFDTLPTNMNIGNVNVRIPGFPNGYSTPIITPLDSNGRLYLVAGCEEGNIRVYAFDRDSIYHGTFRKKFDSYSDIDEGERTALTVADLTGDGKLEMVVSNYRGGISFLSQSDSLVYPVSSLQVHDLKSSIEIYPNPAATYINITMKEFNNHLPVRITVVNLLGTKITEQRTTGEQNITVNLSGLASGIYFIKVQQGSKVTTRKLMVLPN